MISRSDAILRRENQADTECENGCRNDGNNEDNNGCKHDNNNDGNRCQARPTSASVSVSSVREEEPYAKRCNSQSDSQSHKAPLVGWRNGSPTICPSSYQQRSDIDWTSVSSPSKSCSIREISLDSTNAAEGAEGAERATDAIEPIEPTERNGASNKIQGIPVRDEYPKSAVCTRNRRVRDSIDSLGVSERGDSSSFIAREAKRVKPKVPDGGWGWVVVLASLVISMVADGVSFSFGLLYIEFLHEFGASKSKTAWIGSLFMAVPLLSGPIMSALVDRYGCRNMTIAGGLISGFGFILSIFSHTIEVMYLTFGVIAGLGLGLCYVTAVVSIAFWFDKKRTLAVSLGACGTGIGTFVYAPLTTYLIEEYGWRGACLLLAGTFFNMIVAGTVMRDPEWWILEQRKQDQTLPKKLHGRSDGSSSDEFPGVEELRRLLRSDHAPEYFLQNLSTSTKTVNGAKMQTTSVVNLPTFVKRSEKVRERG